MVLKTGCSVSAAERNDCFPILCLIIASSLEALLPRIDGLVYLGLGRGVGGCLLLTIMLLDYPSIWSMLLISYYLSVLAFLLPCIPGHGDVELSPIPLSLGEKLFPWIGSKLIWHSIVGIADIWSVLCLNVMRLVIKMQPPSQQQPIRVGLGVEELLVTEAYPLVQARPRAFGTMMGKAILESLFVTFWI